MSILADIASGETDWADIFFLVAVILFTIGAILALQVKTWYATLIAAGLAFVSLGFLLL